MFGHFLGETPFPSPDLQEALQIANDMYQEVHSKDGISRPIADKVGAETARNIASGLAVSWDISIGHMGYVPWESSEKMGIDII